jgi:hypothetical protein
LWFWLLRVRVPSVTRPARTRNPNFQNPSSKRGWPRHFGISVARRLACPVLNYGFMLNPAVIEFSEAKAESSDFWIRLLNDEQLRDFADLEKLVIGCEIIAALDAVDLLAAA